MNELRVTRRVEGALALSAEHAAILAKLTEPLDAATVTWMASTTNQKGEDLALIVTADGEVGLYHEDLDWDRLEVVLSRYGPGEPGYRMYLPQVNLNRQEIYWLLVCLQALEADQVQVNLRGGI